MSVFKRLRDRLFTIAASPFNIAMSDIDELASQPALTLDAGCATWRVWLEPSDVH